MNRAPAKRHSATAPEVTNGRPTDTSWEAVRHRLLLHVLPSMHGNAFATVRVADLRAAVARADEVEDTVDAAERCAVAEWRIARALRILNPEAKKDEPS